MKLVGGVILVLNIFAALLGNVGFSVACALVSLLSSQFLLVLVSYRTANEFHSLRSTGTLEVQHTGSVATEEFFQSFHRALLRRLCLPSFLVGLGLVINRPVSGHLDDSSLYVIMMALLFVAQFPAIKWVSMFFGFRDRNRTTAFLKAVFLVLILPALFLPFTAWSIILFIAEPPFWYQWGSHKMRRALENLPSSSQCSSSLKPT